MPGLPPAPPVPPPAPPPIEVGTTLADGTLRLWLAQQAVAKGETLLAAQLTSVSRIGTSASSILGWTVTIALALGAVVSAALAPAASSGTAATAAAPKVPAAGAGIAAVVPHLPGSAFWPAIAALVLTLASAVFCVLVLWPGYWSAGGQRPDIIMGVPYGTELEAAESIAAGYADGATRNANALNRLQKLLRTAWVLFAAAPFVGGAVYVIGLLG